MKKFLIVIGALVALVIVALLVAPMVIPVDTYKKELLAQSKCASSGRKLGGGSTLGSLCIRFWCVFFVCERLLRLCGRGVVLMAVLQVLLYVEQDLHPQLEHP